MKTFLCLILSALSLPYNTLADYPANPVAHQFIISATVDEYLTVINDNQKLAVSTNHPRGFSLVSNDRSLVSIRTASESVVIGHGSDTFLLTVNY